MDPTRIDALLALPAEDAEGALIDLYKDREALRMSARRLGRFPDLQVRMALIERAEADFHAGRYYATVQTLLSVMDGFVNDLEPNERRGLHARAEDEMIAWDSVVGHHMGLSHAHSTFKQSFHRTSTEEIHELYRNGIVHGVLINYDNAVVAAKAWNRLYAVADWATSRQKRTAPPKERPSWRELLRTISENRRQHRLVTEALDRWRPSSIDLGQAGFDTDPVVAASQAYLEAWTHRNFGGMAALLSPLLADETPGRTAGMVRSEFGAITLAAFDLERVDHVAPAVAHMDVRLYVGTEAELARMRWIRGDSDGGAVAPNQAGSWRLMTWTLTAMASERRSDAT